MTATDTAPDASPAAPAAEPARPQALVGRRLLALLYDLFPMLGVWFLVGVIALIAHRGDAIHADTLAGWLELIALWTVTGLYATVSWRRGGQTLGMRPWRVRVTGRDGKTPSLRALWLRYAVGTASLLFAGLGFWWAWLDRDRLAWHDRASGTRLVRIPKPS